MSEPSAPWLDTPPAHPKPERRLPAERKAIAAQSAREYAVLEREATRYASALVQGRCAGICEACGQRRRLDAAHGFPKGKYESVRFDSKNLFGLCRQCHERYGKSWGHWMAWMIQQLGPAEFELLRARAQAPAPDIRDVVAFLRAGVWPNERKAA